MVFRPFHGFSPIPWFFTHSKIFRPFHDFSDFYAWGIYQLVTCWGKNIPLHWAFRQNLACRVVTRTLSCWFCQASTVCQGAHSPTNEPGTGSPHRGTMQVSWATPSDTFATINSLQQDRHAPWPQTFRKTSPTSQQIGQDEDGVTTGNEAGSNFWWISLKTSERWTGLPGSVKPCSKLFTVKVRGAIVGFPAAKALRDESEKRVRLKSDKLNNSGRFSSHFDGALKVISKLNSVFFTNKTIPTAKPISMKETLRFSFPNVCWRQLRWLVVNRSLKSSMVPGIRKVRWLSSRARMRTELLLDPTSWKASSLSSVDSFNSFSRLPSKNSLKTSKMVFGGGPLGFFARTRVAGDFSNSSAKVKVNELEEGVAMGESKSSFHSSFSSTKSTSEIDSEGLIELGDVSSTKPLPHFWPCEELSRCGFWREGLWCPTGATPTLYMMPKSTFAAVLPENSEFSIFKKWWLFTTSPSFILFI